MAVPAVPSQAFADVQRYLRQKRATGQTVTPREEKLAWEAYWDSMASQHHTARELGLRERALEEETSYRDELLDLRREQIEDEEDAAKIRGIVEIGGLLGTGALLLKDTKMGKAVAGRLGLGSAATGAPAEAETTTVAGTKAAAPSAAVAKSAAPVSAVDYAAPPAAQIYNAPSVGTAGLNIPMATTTGPLTVGVPAATAPAVGTSFAIPSAASLGPGGGIPTLSGSAVKAAAPAGWSAATGAPSAAGLGMAAGGAGLAGAAGSYLGGKVAGEKGAVTGGLATGATAGALLSGPAAPVGAVVGAVIGGLTSVVTGGKEGDGKNTPEEIKAMHKIQARRREATYGGGGLI